MSKILDNNKLIELVIEKHNKFMEIFKGEFSELENKLHDITGQSDVLKKELGEAETRITVLNEKYFLLFHHAKKQREELFNKVLIKMREVKAPNIQDVVRISGRLEGLENKLKISRNIDEEEKIIMDVKKLLFDFESEAGKAGISVSLNSINDRLDEAIAAHKEFIAIQHKPEQDSVSVKELDKQIGEIEERNIWLKKRIESHSHAIDYWEKQKGVINVE